MDPKRLESYAERSRALTLDGIDWEAVRARPVAAEPARALRYMQDTEMHTIIYLRELLATRAIDDPIVLDFLGCWVHEELAHGRALQRVLQESGEVMQPRARSKLSAAERFQEKMIGSVSRLWHSFLAVHMTWGAINELTALSAYRRLAELAGHPVLDELLPRIALDESRHFGFYYNQAQQWLSRPRVAPVARFLVQRFWGPVGSGVQPTSETRFVAGYLFSGSDGREAAQRVDRTIRSLPGFEGVPLLENWLDRARAV